MAKERGTFYTYEFTVQPDPELNCSVNLDLLFRRLPRTQLDFYGFATFQAELSARGLVATEIHRRPAATWESVD